MSNHAARPRPEPRARAARLAGYLFVPVVVVLAIAFAPRLYRHWFLPDNAWPTTQATILETRVVPLAPVDSAYTPGLLYRIEVLARWNDNGSPYEAWVPTTKTGRDRAWLALWAAQQGKHCVVRQSPRNPSARLAYFQ